MDKKNKGLADTDDAEFILNESGTSVSIDKPGEMEQAFTEEQRENAPEENASQDNQ